ncbi:hypothetical protein [Streptomyces sp. NPDC002671]
MNGSSSSSFKTYVLTHAKAVVSALVSGFIAFLSSLITALQGGSTGIETITDGQWLTACLAFFVGLGLTHGVTAATPNKPST